MSRIIFDESYITVMPTYNKTDIHKHPFMHLFLGIHGCNIIAENKKIQGNIIILKSNIEHVVNEKCNYDFFLLIEPTSTVAEQLSDKYLYDDNYYAINENIESITKDIKSLSDKEVIQLIDKILLNLDISIESTHARDTRIEQVISKMISGEWLTYHVKDIAKSVFLSESRLTHLFKEEVGISLKSYILIRRMERAYKLVSSGKKITHAAMESGFSSPAHLAYTCKTLMGISITDVLMGSKK